MKFLNPDIEALSKHLVKGKSLTRSSTSCGIFQDCDYNEVRPDLYQQGESRGKTSSKQ